VRRGGGRSWLAAALALFALGRWLLMASPAPYKAVLPLSWFSADTLGLTRVSINALLCTVLLIVVPIVVVRRSQWWEPTKQLLALGGRGWGWAAGGAMLALALAWGARACFPSLCTQYPLHASVMAELAYGVVILSTEVFYRGLLLGVWGEAFGRWALPAMALVCALDHVGAPAVEVISCGFGALLLGWLALRVRSIWPGVVMHAVLALSVDVGCWPMHGP
jgi:membrane protease YdiL (CAAX protease family)